MIIPDDYVEVHLDTSLMTAHLLFAFPTMNQLLRSSLGTLTLKISSRATISTLVNILVYIELLYPSLESVLYVKHTALVYSRSMIHKISLPLRGAFNLTQPVLSRDRRFICSFLLLRGLHGRDSSRPWDSWILLPTTIFTTRERKAEL